MVSIAKLPGARPKPLLPNDTCPKCKRATLIVERGQDIDMGGMVDRFVRCMACGHRGPLGGLRVIK